MLFVRLSACPVLPKSQNSEKAYKYNIPFVERSIYFYSEIPPVYVCPAVWLSVSQIVCLSDDVCLSVHLSSRCMYVAKGWKSLCMNQNGMSCVHACLISREDTVSRDISDILSVSFLSVCMCYMIVPKRIPAQVCWIILARLEI